MSGVQPTPTEIQENQKEKQPQIFRKSFSFLVPTEISKKVILHTITQQIFLLNTILLVYFWDEAPWLEMEFLEDEIWKQKFWILENNSIQSIQSLFLGSHV